MWRRTFAVFAAAHAVSGSVCTIFEVVNVNVATGSATWEDGVVYQDVYTTPCTKLRFEYDGTIHGSVYKMRSKADYDACNFETESNAFRLSGASTWTEFEITHVHAGKELFFATTGLSCVSRVGRWPTRSERRNRQRNRTATIFRGGYRSLS